MDEENFGIFEEPGECTLAEIEVGDESQLNYSHMPGATVLASSDQEGLVQFFARPPPPIMQMSTEVMVQRTLEHPALKQILQEADGQPDFDPAAEQMKIRDFLAGVTNNKMTTEESVFQAHRMSAPTNGPRVYKCRDCGGTFDSLYYYNHVCLTENAVKPNFEAAVQQQDKTRSVKLSTAPAIVPAPRYIRGSERVILENQIRLRRYMKDELKYDVTTGIDNSLGLSKKKGKQPNECSICDRQFVHASGLVRHMEKHALNLIAPQANAPSIPPPPAPGLAVVTKCNDCGRIFYDCKLAMRHVRVHYPEQPKICEPLIDKNVSQKKKFIRRMLKGDWLFLCVYAKKRSIEQKQAKLALEAGLFSTLILGSVLQCEFCEFVFADIEKLLVHSAAHVVEKRFECTACDITMNTAKEASVHFQSDCIFMREEQKRLDVSLFRYFVCNVCEQKFSTADVLQEHRNMYYHYFPRLSADGSALLLPCEYCDVNFTAAHEVEAHNLEKHVNKKRREKETRMNGAGNGRLRQYLCDVCGKSYTQSSHLWQHLRFHQGVKPFACQEANCGRKFTIRPDLNDHIRKCHTGERPYHCLVCGKRFLTGSVFYQHRLIHRGERRYECEECGKRFYRADALKNHQRIHTGEKPFSCLFCTKTFRQRGDRDKHIRARHSHLNANTRLMMQMQKIQLETSDAIKSRMRDIPMGEGDGYSTSMYQVSGSQEDGEMQLVTDEQELRYYEPMDGFEMQQYVEEAGPNLMNEVEYEEVIVYENTEEEPALYENPEEEPALAISYEPQPEPQQMEEEIPVKPERQKRKIVVVKNNPSLPLYPTM
ncbi:testis-specific zinc finger protein topi isoform X1 [Drosophila guanche]|uniref:Blast:Testis-specific zinc finger protein topi n=1 Tax=Drosophila guanche TaxID=7266 RepID=A0A3B0KMJ1_DROGU|nr:testis-specific zinc finger protein topi isoform X1 [Drosophila guanche]SPP87799.1 blast:Testis-specific zinc finger protein topi [Drosophila guanche]